jgi:hypothetical protein
METPKIKPIALKEYTAKQSKYKQVPQLPSRTILLGPSGSGKGILLQNMILDIYRGCFERIFIFSPSINLDHSWYPVKKYIEREMKIDTKKEKTYFDEYEPEDLENIISTQRKVIEYMKNKKYKNLYNILIIIDDFADNPNFSRNSKLLHSCYTRGRHSSISTWTSTQKYCCLSPIIRVNATSLYVFRLRNFSDLQAVIEETSALVDKKTLLEIYNLATNDEPYSFLFLDLTAKKLDDIFWIRHEKKIMIEST